jgi:hypothetical protein
VGSFVLNVKMRSLREKISKWFVKVHDSVNVVRPLLARIVLIVYGLVEVTARSRLAANVIGWLVWNALCGVKYAKRNTA